jgi:hypothetical protein
MAQDHTRRCRALAPQRRVGRFEEVRGGFVLTSPDIAGPVQPSIAQTRHVPTTQGRCLPLRRPVGLLRYMNVQPDVDFSACATRASQRKFLRYLWVFEESNLGPALRTSHGGVWLVFDHLRFSNKGLRRHKTSSRRSSTLPQISKHLMPT